MLVHYNLLKIVKVCVYKSIKQSYEPNVFLSKTTKTLTSNTPMRIYINKLGNRTTFKIKLGYYLELWTLKTVKLLGSAENKITKGKNVESAPHLETNEVALVDWNIVRNDY